VSFFFIEPSAPLETKVYEAHRLTAILNSYLLVSNACPSLILMKNHYIIKLLQSEEEILKLDPRFPAL
jgi:hypothetical protein